MAELHVQKKENSAWPWILGAVLVLALLFYLLWGRGDGTNVATTDDNDSTMVSEVPNSDPSMMGSASGTVAGSSVDEFMQFVDARSSRAAGAAHDYTADGLRKLSNAISEVVSGDSVGGVTLQPRIDEIRERADAMQQNANSSEHATQAREAFAVAASLIARMRNGSSGMGNTTTSSNQDALQDAAMAIEPTRPLLDQSDRIEQFFAEAGNALRGVGNTPR